MKQILILFSICLLLTCKTNGHVEPKIENSLTNDNPSTNDAEDFNNFFSKFKSDSIFQISRIHNPLKIQTSDGDDIEETNQNVNFVSFNQTDWDVKITYNVKILTSDSTVVILEGIDTGVHIEHVFILQDKIWFLNIIKNLSD